MAITVLVQGTSIGIDAGPFNIYHTSVDAANILGSINYTRTQVLAGLTFSNVPDGVNSFYIVSSGICGNSGSANLVVPTNSPTAAPTASPTASPTAAPVTPAPVTPAPVTPSPVTPSPTAAPITPAPVTPSPITPSPTAAPVTPAPVTPAPVTPSPTAAPVTPAPVTPSPTAAPVTPAPTPAPTLSPTYPSPVSAVLSWDCLSTVCTYVGPGSGTYVSEAECLLYCGGPAPTAPAPVTPSPVSAPSGGGGGGGGGAAPSIGAPSQDESLAPQE
jgi:hypothetical protein